MKIDFINGKIYSASVVETKNFGIYADIRHDNGVDSGFIPNNYCIDRTDGIKTEDKINVIFINQSDEEGKLPVFREVFDYEAEEQIDFKLFEEFEKNEIGYRKLTDSKNRIITTRKKYWQTGSYKNKPNHNSVLKYTVIGFSERYYPLLEELNTNHPFTVNEFQIGQEIELIFEEEYFKENIGHRILIDSNGRRYDTKRFPWQRGPKYNPPQKGDAIKYIIEFITNDGYPICKEVMPKNPYKLTKEDIPNNVLKYFNNEPVEDEKLSLYQAMNEDYKHGNANWILSFTNLLKSNLLDLLERKDYYNCLNVCEDLLTINDLLKSSGFLLSYRSKKRVEISDAIDYSNNKTLSTKLMCNIILSPQPNKKIITIIDNILKSDSLNFTENDISNINNFNLILNYADEYLTNKEVIEIIDHISNNAEFYSHKTVAILNSKRKLLRKKIFTNKEIIDFENLENSQELSFLIYLQEIETKRCEYYNDLPEIILSKAIVKRFQAYYNPKKFYELLKESISLLNEKIPINSIYDDQYKIENWFKRLNIELGMNYEYLSIKFDDIDSKISNLENAFGYYCKARSARSFLISSLLDYYKLYKMFQEEKELSDIILKSNLYYKKINDDEYISLLIRYPIMKSFVSLFRVFSCIDDSTDESNKFLLEINSASSNLKLPFIKIDKIASLILANNLLTNINESLDISSAIRTLFLEETLNIKNIFFEEIDEGDELLDLVLSEESNKLEFKGSFSADLKRYCNTNEIILDKRLNREVLKSVVGMLNANGGKIIIGILERDNFKKEQYVNRLKNIGSIFKDNKIIVGVEPEIDKHNWDIDKHILYINDIIRNRIGKRFLSHIIISNKIVMNRTIYEINISSYPAENGVWLKTSEGELFYLRENNQTIKKSPSEAFEFLRMRNLVDKQLTRNQPDVKSE